MLFGGGALQRADSDADGVRVRLPPAHLEAVIEPDVAAVLVRVDDPDNA